MRFYRTLSSIKHIIIITLLLISIYIIHPRLLSVHNLLPTSWNTPSDCIKLCPYTSNLGQHRLKFNFFHSVRHFPEFVCPQNFRNLADWVYGWPDQFFEHMETTTTDGQQIARCLPPGSIIYVRMFALDAFFTKVYPYLINKFVLITGEGDDSSPTNISYLDQPNSKIIHWFGQNGQIYAGQNSKFTHIPIGINCYEMADAIKSLHRTTYPRHSYASLYAETDEPLKYIRPLDMTERALSISGIDQNHLVLINFDLKTDGTGLRSRIWSDMCNPNEPKPFVKCIVKPTGVHLFRLEKIYKRNRNYPFWISPRGNGIDCHRTWEALYLDIIPIVWNSTLNVLYENLPIVIVNDHKEITESFLRHQLKIISMKKLRQSNSSRSRTYQYEKLHHSFWRRIILNKSRYAYELSGMKYRRRCWQARSTLLESIRYIPFLKYT